MTPGMNSADYADLLVTFQPRSITSEQDADHVQQQIDALIDKGDLSESEQEILSLLGDLMLAWVSDRYDMPDLLPQEAIRALLEAGGLHQGDLVGPVFATKSIASEVLNGKRRITYNHVMRLAEFFHVAPGVFFSESRRRGVA